MNVSQKTVADANTTLLLTIRGDPGQTTLNLDLIENASVTSFNDSYGFQLKSQELGEQMVKKITNTLYEARLLGSNFPLHMPMKKPSIAQTDDGVIIYDADYSKN